jgi:hypothetical protein
MRGHRADGTVKKVDKVGGIWRPTPHQTRAWKEEILAEQDSVDDPQPLMQSLTLTMKAFNIKRYLDTLVAGLALSAASLGAQADNISYEYNGTVTTTQGPGL